MYAKNIKPVAVIKTSGLVSDFVVDGNLLYAATDEGSIDIIDIVQQKVVDQIKFKPLRTAIGISVPTRIFSVDRFQGKTLIVSSADHAYRNVWIHDGKKLRKIIDSKEKVMAKRALFIDENLTFMGTFGSDVILYNKSDTYQNYTEHISYNAMGGIALNESKKKAAVGDEGGTVRIIDVATSNIDLVLNSENRDNIYRVAFRNNIVITASQDMRVGVYLVDDNRSYHIKSDFLVYCVGMSISGKTGIYSSGYDHELQLFDIKTSKKGDRLIGHNAIVNKIVFVDEKSIVSAGDERNIFFWVID